MDNWENKGQANFSSILRAFSSMPVAVWLMFADAAEILLEELGG
ncbi:MAG: hypothetical protein NT166_27640 [Candidatus Aminicenantes bacterium]|nr:hypothetical protein [Candidatus Aminicenantes bacterium]